MIKRRLRKLRSKRKLNSKLKRPRKSRRRLKKILRLESLLPKRSSKLRRKSKLRKTQKQLNLLPPTMMKKLKMVTRKKMRRIRVKLPMHRMVDKLTNISGVKLYKNWLLILIYQKEQHLRCCLSTLPKLSLRLLSRESRNQSSMVNLRSLSKLMIQCGLLKLITKEAEFFSLLWQRKIRWAGGIASLSVIPRLTPLRYLQKTPSYLTLTVKLAQL